MTEAYDDRRDITASHHHGDPFSTAAHTSIRGEAKVRQQAAVLEYLRATGGLGATSDEVEVDLDLPHQSASARLTELRAKGLTREDGRRRTRSGRWARVQVAVVADPVQGELL